MAKQRVRAWYLTCGSEICIFCLQVYIYEHRRHCDHCDVPMCPLCALEREGPCLCPPCYGEGKES